MTETQVKTTTITKESGNRELDFSRDRLREFVERVTDIESKHYLEKVSRIIESKQQFSSNELTTLLVNTALENVDEAGVQWTFDAAKICLNDLYSQAAKNRAYDKANKYGDFYGLLKTLAGKGVYSPDILEKYTREEIISLAQMIEPERDLLLDYTGLHMLKENYLATDHAWNVYELPQERFLIIAMSLMQNEPAQVRETLVAEAYWALSNLFMTVATPTLANAGKAAGQLSSCFIDTVDDSLDNIFGSNSDIAQLSKHGGGIGMYFGKVRSMGASIRNYENAAGGVVPWIRLVNDTAVSVDQLGQRPGAVAVYLDVFHKDIADFLELKTNNGDERRKAHDIFPGVCLPDLFMEQVVKRGDWYMFDPHEVKKVMGFALEDYYDEQIGSGSFRDKYEECVQSNKLTKTKMPAIELMKSIMVSQLETGTPFMFYRDEANRMNPMKEFRADGSGIVKIYSSNLCTEIFQNMSPTVMVEETVEGDYILTKKKAGDFVVCNLSSINLGRAVPADVLERLIPIQVRMLDNTIDINKLPVKQAQITNHKYRSIGLGTFGWHHLLALKGIHWETDEAVEFADELYEKIAFLSINASNALAKEKGAFPLFEGSDWQTGDFFTLRDYTERLSSIDANGNLENLTVSSNIARHDWASLANEVAKTGVRNAYIEAVAPNSGTSVIAGSTASIDPVFKPYYHEEKKEYKLPIVAPGLDHNTYDIYRKSAYVLDQRWSIKQNAARQRHVDQGISFNFFVPKTIKASMLLELHLQAWRSRFKSTYYVRSTSTDVKDCTWCES